VFDDGRVLDTLEQLTTDAAKHAAAPVWSLPDAELIDCLDAAHRLERAAAAIRHHLVRQIDARTATATALDRHRGNRHRPRPTPRQPTGLRPPSS
jgi:hypothetical protein